MTTGLLGLFDAAARVSVVPRHFSRSTERDFGIWPPKFEDSAKGKRCLLVVVACCLMLER